MAHYHECLKRASRDCLILMLEYIGQRRGEAEDNLMHAQRQGSREMMEVYTGHVDAWRCAESEVMWTVKNGC